jgi:hypothetical protein
VLVLERVIAEDPETQPALVAPRYEEPTSYRYAPVQIEPDALFLDVVVAS